MRCEETCAYNNTHDVARGKEMMEVGGGDTSREREERGNLGAEREK